MKSKFNILLIAIIAISLGSCINGKKKSVKKAETGFTVIDTSATVKWTAYKTTDKKPVSGIFKTVNIKNSVAGSNPAQALNNLEFSIPVSSLFSNNADRDVKLVNLFFGVMSKTTLLTGKIKITDSKSGLLEVTMNGTTNSLPITLVTNNNSISFKGIMSLKNWHAEAALASLNKACFDLHKGPDGISKTWDDVLIEASVLVKK